MRKKYFNLVEVALSIGILAIGVTAILALFPVGFDRSRQAIGENYCAEAADSLFSYIARKGSENSTNWNNLFGVSGGSSALIPAEKPSSSTDSVSGWNQTGGGGDMNDIYYVNDPPLPGVYGIKVQTGETIDFSGEAMIWQENLPEMLVSNESVSVDTDIAVRVNLEISWPVEKPYEKRKKTFYCFELFNGNS